MRLILKIFIGIIILGCKTQPFAQDIDTIKFSGLKRTNETYLRRFVSHARLEGYDSLLVIEDERKLRTLSSILDVSHNYTNNDSIGVLTYNITERWTLLPVGDFGATNENIWIGAGFMETNFLGRGIYFYGYLQYKTPFAVHVIWRDPYIGKSKFGYQLQYLNQEIVERIDYQLLDVYEHQDISLEATYELKFEKDLFVRIARENKSVFLDNALIGDRKAIIFLGGFRFQKLDYRHFMINGWKNRFRFGIHSTNEGSTFSIENELKLYKTIARTNLAGKIFIGYNSEKNVLLYPYIIDSYKNIRGSGFRQARGNTFVASNLECRYTLLENNLGGIQILAFTDLGRLINRHHSSESNTEIFIFSGPGIRFNLKKVHNAVLSIDYGTSLITPHRSGWVIGWGHYF